MELTPAQKTALRKLARGPAYRATQNLRALMAAGLVELHITKKGKFLYRRTPEGVRVTMELHRVARASTK